VNHVSAMSRSLGCFNPLCPHANWDEPDLPRWWLRLDDGSISEFAACDDACARAAVRFIHARLGRSENHPAALTASLIS